MIWLKVIVCQVLPDQIYELASLSCAGLQPSDLHSWHRNASFSFSKNVSILCGYFPLFVLLYNNIFLWPLYRLFLSLCPQFYLDKNTSPPRIFDGKVKGRCQAVAGPACTHTNAHEGTVTVNATAL